jgi:hypothetical protein
MAEADEPQGSRGDSQKQAVEKAGVAYVAGLGKQSLDERTADALAQHASASCSYFRRGQAGYALVSSSLKRQTRRGAF